MVAIRLKVDIPANGIVTLQLPDDFPRDQEVEIEVRLKTELSAPQTLTPAETAAMEEDIQQSLAIIQRGGERKTGAEIVAYLREHGGGWEDYGIEDPVEWLEARRREDWNKRHQDQP